MQNTREKRAENFLVSIWNHYDSCADYLDGITDTRIFGGNIMEQKDIQAEKQLIQTWKSIMFLSWFTSIVGIGCWIQAGNEIIVGNMNKGVIWLIYGMVHIIVACFGIRFSKRKNEKLQDSKYIVRRKKGICILGIVTYCVTVCVFLLTLIFLEMSYIAFIYMACCTSCLLIISFFWFSMYREQKIIVREKEIVICNFFGKRRMIDRQEIGQITSDQNHVRYGFMNKQNQQLFAVSVNMVDAVAFIQDTLDDLEKR